MIPPLAQLTVKRPTREVICGDALEWLRAREVLGGCSVITSLPDVSELGLDLPAWEGWFTEAARMIVARLPAAGLALFLQSDIRRAGVWIDKGFLVAEGARRAGGVLLFHKIVCRKPPGTVDFGRATFSHLLAFGAPQFRFQRPAAIPDVLVDGGEPLWSKGMGIGVSLTLARIVAEHTSTTTIVDPFCGWGTVLAAANAVGLDAIGIERARGRCAQARRLRIDTAAILAP